MTYLAHLVIFNTVIEILLSPFVHEYLTQTVGTTRSYSCTHRQRALVHQYVILSMLRVVEDAGRYGK